MLIKSLLVVLGTAALAAKLVQRLSGPALRDARAGRGRRQEEIARWEAEGGQLPVTGQAAGGAAAAGAERVASRH